MNNTKNTALDEPIERRELQKTIADKEKLLIELIEEIEHFKIDLSITKQEYDIKIGRLYLKLDETNLEILRFKKIENLINEGLSFEEAQEAVNETLKERREQIEDEYKKFNEEEKDLEKRKATSEEDREELKKLFHKLAHKYHPDLNGGDDTIMKKINKAYSENDLETLRTIDKGGNAGSTNVETVEELRAQLTKLEELIKKAIDEQKQLKHSEWAVLKKNIEDAKKQRRDILSELAEKILEDIANKQMILDELKKKHGK